MMLVWTAQIGFRWANDFHSRMLAAETKLHILASDYTMQRWNDVSFTFIEVTIYR